MKKITIHQVTFCGILAAVYAALTICTSAISYGQIQFRLAEALCILPYFNPVSTIGLTLGCLIANLFSTVSALDIIVGTAATLLACLLVLGGVPFFLPKMHERYTFGADVLALVIAAYRPKRMALPLLFGLASYICYTGGLPGDAIFDLKWATLFQGAAVALTAAALYKSLHEEKTEAVLTEVKA